MLVHVHVVLVVLVVLVAVIDSVLLVAVLVVLGSDVEFNFAVQSKNSCSETEMRHCVNVVVVPLVRVRVDEV